MMIQTELVFYRDPTTPLIGPASAATFAFPGAALTASTLRWWGNVPGQTLYYARWLLAWVPAGGGVQLCHADSGPSNYTEIARLQRGEATPVVDGADITVPLRNILAAGQTKHLCQRMHGNGSIGAKIYSSSIELIWEVQAGDNGGASGISYDDTALRARIEALEVKLVAASTALA
jgi:hypothetical protein